MYIYVLRVTLCGKQKKTNNSELYSETDKICITIFYLLFFIYYYFIYYYFIIIINKIEKWY